jgi:hypothetical protein
MESETRAIRGPEMSSFDETIKDITAARVMGIPITMHAIGMGAFRPIEELNKAKLLGPDMNYAHDNFLTDHEFQLIALTNPGNVDSVFLTDKAVKRHGEMVGIDLEEYSKNPLTEQLCIV